MRNEYYEETIKTYSDSQILKRLAVKHPAWRHKDRKWRQWRQCLHEEARRRGLLG